MIYIVVVGIGSLLFFGFVWYLLSAPLLQFINTQIENYPYASWFPQEIVSFTTALATYLSVLFMFAVILWVITNSEKLRGYLYGS